MSSMLDRFYELSAHLNSLLDSDPAEAVRQARAIDLDTPERFNLMSLRAAVLVDGGALTQQKDAIEEGLAFLRELESHFPTVVGIVYNLANGLVAAVGNPPGNQSWLDHQESTREHRAEARRCYWRVTQDSEADPALKTQSWTNLANQLGNSFRLGEAHDARLAALEIDPGNGVAAYAAARDLLWLFDQGGCSDLTRIEAVMLVKNARQQGRVAEYAGAQAAEQISAFANELEDPPPPPPPEAVECAHLLNSRTCLGYGKWLPFKQI
ncbi:MULTISPECIES: hypothetical protein [unclassified Pseudomonas]|uniref:hypothetical protein n=1 Tax=unclassified Pseudomonas TaxID=196821 RepID=UPI00244C7BDE|nr:MULTISPECIES: hypothetical protein [unclassified Pseudomonas]MDH0897691.1 hypothetical protein [Pseudomonas sp. GD03875]MDH1067842.1 hypothetical protein [Pseudomonas sp. GD03985]